MLHDEYKPRHLESQDASATEPSSKRIKSTEEPYGKSYYGLQRLHEEIHVTKTHSGFIPLSISDSDEEAQNKKETAEVKAFMGKNTVLPEPSKSVNNTEITRSKKVSPPSKTNILKNKEDNDCIREHKNEEETELYSTSKAFIGPIYKSEANRVRDQRKKREMVSKQVLRGGVPKIEDELSQFYNEIDQLESDENRFNAHLQRAETNSHGQLAEYNKWNQIVCANSQEWSCRTSPSGGQCFYNNAPRDRRTGSEQYPYSDPSGHRSDNRQCCNNERDVWEMGQLCNKQESSRFWNDSVSQFRPSWQHTHPFIIPYGPPPPQFTPRFNFHEPNSSSLCSDTFHPSKVGPFKNTHINMSSAASDENNAYHFGNHNTQPTRNGYNMPDGHMGNGFCETRPCWKEIKTYPDEGSSNVSQQFPEGKLCESQRLLLILRGLPGSGKTTLSRILLDQSRDGIIFSTDDYFRQNSGCWSYNVGQLGAAHDWNQKRARQAMDQGRSPIIIDNTNTQAWEMKPYVEAALEKGYRIEFHEPDTWWKFDPEELEKRNEHGVSHEKIVQMLERYEYEISIPIVMNSVLPFHKTSQWPPPQRRQRESVVKRKHRLHKMKQRRKQKRNRRMKGATTKTMAKTSGEHFTPSDEDSSQSGLEDSEDNGKSAYVIGYPNELKESVESGSANDNSLTHCELQKASVLVSDMVDPVLDKSLKMNAFAGDTCLPLMCLPSVPSDNRTEQSFSDHLPNEIKSVNLVEGNSNDLECDKQSSSLKLDHVTENTTEMLTNMKDKDKDAPTEVKLESGLERELLSNEEKLAIPHLPGPSKKNEGNTWAFFSFDLAHKQPHTSLDESHSRLTWPDGTSKIMFEQRPKRERRSKQVFSGMSGELIDYQPNKELVKRDGEVLHGNNSITDCAQTLQLTENIHRMPCTEMGDLTTESTTKASDPNNISKLALPRKKGRCKRIFKLAPSFGLPRQIPVRKDEEVLKDIAGFVEQEETSNEEPRENDKQSLGCYKCPVPFSYDVVIESSPHLDVEPLLCKYSSQLAQKSTDFSAKVASPPIQICTYVSCKASLPSEQHITAFDQAVEANTEKKRGETSPDIQPDILCSVQEITDSSAENSEKIQVNEAEQPKYSPIKYDQDPLKTKASVFGLPLSLGFALQLVEHFGSPGIPLDTLLPDDYVVPLDWATSKEIYLLWKTSVEKKQKTIISKEDSFLPVGKTAQEGSNKDDQDRKESPEANS